MGLPGIRPAIVIITSQVIVPSMVACIYGRLLWIVLRNSPQEERGVDILLLEISVREQALSAEYVPKVGTCLRM